MTTQTNPKNATDQDTVSIPAPPPEALLYTAVGIASMLRISRSRIYELMASGDLPRLRIKGSTRISRRSIDGYIDRLMAEAQMAS